MGRGPGFRPSATSLSVLAHALSGDLSQGDEESGEAQKKTEVPAWTRYARMAACGEPRWASSNLCYYALQRSSEATENYDESLLDVVVGGLYHEGRMNDGSVLDQLLIQWIHALTNGRQPSEPTTDLVETLELFDREWLSTIDPEGFGHAQRTLAAANSKALRRLYEAMPLRGARRRQAGVGR